MITKQEARAIVRKALKRVPEGEEIRHLNIMPMMDIMTILLVAFLFSANQNAALSLGDAELPESRSFDPKPEQATTLTISETGVLVQGLPVVEVNNWDVDPSLKKDGAFGRQIPKLSRFLGTVREDEEQEALEEGRKPPKVPELFIIADKETPFRLLLDVFSSARAEEAGYRRFRLIVLQSGQQPPPSEG